MLVMRFFFFFFFFALEKEMATHSSVLAWRFPGTGEPGGLPSMGSPRLGHDWSNLAAYFYFVAISGYSALTLGLGFTLLWELNAAADLKGGRIWVVTWARRNGCKYRWSFASCPPTLPHLLLCGLVWGVWDQIPAVPSSSFCSFVKSRTQTLSEAK